MVHVSEEGDDGRAKLERGRIVVLLRLGEQPLLQRDRLTEVDLGPQAQRHQLGRFPGHGRGDDAGDAEFQEFLEHLLGGDAEGLGEAAHGTG